MQPDSEGSSSPRPPSYFQKRDKRIQTSSPWRTIRIPAASSDNQSGASPVILDFLATVQALPVSLIHRWIRTGQILVNGARVQPGTGLRAGDMVRLPNLLNGRRGGVTR